MNRIGPASLASLSDDPDDGSALALFGFDEAAIVWKPSSIQYQRPLLLGPAETATLSLFHRL